MRGLGCVYWHVGLTTRQSRETYTKDIIPRADACSSMGLGLMKRKVRR